MGEKKMSKEYKIEYLKTEDLTPFERNPKNHPEEQIEKLVKIKG